MMTNHEKEGSLKMKASYHRDHCSSDHGNGNGSPILAGFYLIHVQNRVHLGLNTS